MNNNVLVENIDFKITSTGIKFIITYNNSPTPVEVNVVEGALYKVKYTAFNKKSELEVQECTGKMVNLCSNGDTEKFIVFDVSTLYKGKLLYVSPQDVINIEGV